LKTRFNVKVRHKGEQTVDFQIERSTPLQDQVTKAGKACGIAQADLTYYAFQRPNSKYIIQDDLNDERFLIPDGETLMLLNQSQEAETLVVTLDDLIKQVNASADKKAAEQLKKIAFQLENHIKVDAFGEEFIVQGGMERLLAIIQITAATTGAYALKALSAAMLYLNGLEYIKTTPGVLERLISLIYVPNNVSVPRHAAALTFVFTQFVEDGFQIVHTAITRISEENRQKPYQQVVQLLASGDLDTKCNVMTLINVLLKKAPNNRRLKKLLNNLEDAGLFAALERQESVSDPIFLTQLELFRETSGANIAPTQIELSILRYKLQELSEEYDEAKRAVHDFERQQALVAILREELLRYKKALIDSFDQGLLVNAYAPTARFVLVEKENERMSVI